MPTPVAPPRAPLLWLLLPFMAGIALADARPCPPGWLAALAGSAAGLGVMAGVLAMGTKPIMRWLWSITMLGAGMGCGYVCLLARTPPLAGWESTPREVVVTLEIEQVFTPAPKRKTAGGLGRIVAAGPHVAEITGQRVYFSAIRKISVPPARSGRYAVRGVLQTLKVNAENPAGFERYLDNLGIRLTLTRAHIMREERAPGRFARFCTRAEQRCEAILQRGLETHPEALTLYLAMLLGEKAVLSAEQQNAFMRSGTFHIFSISGLHIGVIALAIQSLLLLLRLPRRAAIVCGLAVLWFYTQVTGGSAPAMRALMMVAFLLGSRLFRLPANPLAALTAAALLTLLLDPWQLFSAGFQMSYGVVLALIVMAASLAARWQAAWQPWRDRPAADWGWMRHRGAWLGRKVLDAWAATWTALLASTPTGIGYFGLCSPGALVANLVIIPLSSLAIVAGFLSLLAGLAGYTPGSLLFNRAAALVILAMDWLVRHGTELPGVYFRAHFAAPWLASAALVAVLGSILLAANLNWPRRLGATWWPAAVLALLLFFGVKFG
jgi:competence protein ComEC